ncbi:unnamed protein product [Urochloa humidicola]
MRPCQCRESEAALQQQKQVSDDADSCCDITARLACVSLDASALTGVAGRRGVHGRPVASLSAFPLGSRLPVLALSAIRHHGNAVQGGRALYGVGDSDQQKIHSKTEEEQCWC